MSGARWRNMADTCASCVSVMRPLCQTRTPRSRGRTEARHHAQPAPVLNTRTCTGQRLLLADHAQPVGMRLSAYFGKRLHGMLSWTHAHV